jgi:hypothetical protein
MNHSIATQHHRLHAQPSQSAASWQALLGNAIQSLCALTWRQATPEQVAARDAAAVRALADSCRESDPGFASDLYAAVNRHECAFDAHAIGAR